LSFRVPGQEVLVRWTNALLVILLAYSLAPATWRLLPSPPASEPLTAPVAGAPARDEHGGLGAVARLHLFGEAPAIAARPVPVEAPETRLNLTLRGVFAAVKPESGAAIIAAGNGDENFYRAGDPVAGGAILREVHPERVILERAGRFETLRLPEGSRTGMEFAPPEADVPPPVGSEGDHAGLGDFRERLLQNPQEAFEMVQVSPVMEAGRIKGYRVAPGREPALFRRSGLRPGDVVTSVNGVPLDNPAQLNDVMRQLSAAEALDLTVDRKGRTQQVTVRLD
jgi:general secretion pathway protein C